MNSTIGRPAKGEAALILVPTMRQQCRWSQHVKGGSAMVGFRMNNSEQYMIYYEGNMYDASNLRTFRDRAIIAYGRLVDAYPTVARTIADIGLFEVVGEFNGLTMKLDATVVSYQSWIEMDETLIPS